MSDRPSIAARFPDPPKPARKHTVEVSNFTSRPMVITCECGWHGEAATSGAIVTLWNEHRKEAA